MSVKRKVVLFIASSLDGYIATEEESLDWLMRVEGEGDNGFSEFYDTIDTVLMGKKTYDWVMRQDLEVFPYKGNATFVFTRSAVKDTDDVSFVNKDIESFLHYLKNIDGKNIWLVGGGDLVQSFLQAALIDEIIMIVAPTLLGEGIPLFKKQKAPVDLKLKGVRNFNQFVELHYEVKNE
ncbi:Dihydrofolate reductase [Halolactibacillus halophilus]|uniref:Dihydrofolate reductase n=1 Tax=Halolactibacillus halophilus TaxID=306540 RepID=A0A1I5NWR4_9BACI|nr:dihydrofolate reductase family protein [Halolactibacillus halophilus]GEM01484.1 dihydrofolate reductase [Halolactibacillus halophilus]SFP26248.1 Dihydrofolate reductase [Halolactibacillus halophilus]